MKRVERHIIKLKHTYYAEIDAICFASKNLYNTVMYTVRHSFFYGYGIPSWGKLDDYFQDTGVYKALPAKVSQLVIKQVTDAWDSYFKALAAYREDPSKFTGQPKIPAYKDSDGRNLVKYNNQAYSKRELAAHNVICPSKTSIRIPVKGISRDNLVEIRLVPKYGHYVIEIVYEVDEAISLLQPNGVVAAIDLGLDNLATVVFNTPEVCPFIINGKPLKSVNQWWNKQKARLQGLLPQGQYTSKRIEAITRKRNCYVDHYLHNASKILVNEFVNRGVSKVVIGKNTHWKRNTNLGKVNNQNFVQIPYNKLIDKLTYKLEEVGIEVIVDEESYTSKASFLDWDSIPTYDPEATEKPKFGGKRVKRAWYKAADGTLIHADVNGAYNIGRKVIPTAFAHFKQIVARDRGCLVVHPRRITPVPRTELRSAQALLKTQVAS
jgi:IS605 OrfB family transposase